jgi:putative addiction module CopG family antidote
MAKRALNVTLPPDLAEMVQDKVASGSYASESEVVSAGLRALQAQESGLENWLRTEGVARYDAFHRGGAESRSADQVLAGLRALKSNTATHDEWLRRRVEDSLSDPCPSRPAEDVFARLRSHHAVQGKCE